MKRVIQTLFLIILMSSFVFASSTSIGFTVGATQGTTTIVPQTNNGNFMFGIYALVILAAVFGFMLFNKSKSNKSKAKKNSRKKRSTTKHKTKRK